jgi:3D (Asp-Asp-Asp) domain-containing protein
MNKLLIISLATALLATTVTATAKCGEKDLPVHTDHVETVERTATPSQNGVGREVWESLGEYTLTAYCSCQKCCGYWATIRPWKDGKQIVYTASGEIAEAGKTIAVDTTVIPFGTEVKIGDTVYVAQDTGSSIVGNRIDVYFDDHTEAWNFGMQTSEVFVKRGDIAGNTN